MTSVFISYSSVDSRFAWHIKGHLEKAGIETWLFEDPEKRGGQIYEKIVKAINDASIFLALLSADYLKSETCKHEGSLALNCEKELRKKQADSSFIFVAQVGPLEKLNAGFWSDYDWFDLTGPNQPEITQI